MRRYEIVRVYHVLATLHVEIRPRHSSIVRFHRCRRKSYPTCNLFSCVKNTKHISINILPHGKSLTSIIASIIVIVLNRIGRKMRSKNYGARARTRRRREKERKKERGWRKRKRRKRKLAVVVTSCMVRDIMDFGFSSHLPSVPKIKR